MHDKSCERCHKRPGQTNSQYQFENALSEPPDLGDWLCFQCEEELSNEREYEPKFRELTEQEAQELNALLSIDETT